MKNSIVSEIKRKSENKIVTIFDKLPAIIASVFSVLFSLSIVFQLTNIVNGFVLVFLTVFIVLFVTMNEIVKVNQVKKLFNGIKTAIIPFGITLILSIGLSGIGIWFWVNKSDEIKETSNINKVEKINLIKKEYNNKILNLKNDVFENSKEFESLNLELSFLKSRTTSNNDERTLIRENIYKLQNNIQVQREKFNNSKYSEIESLNELMNNDIDVVNVLYQTNMNKTNKNDLISYIFLTLILITEFAIIILNKILSEKENNFNLIVNSDLAKKFLIQRNILESLYLTKGINNKVNINDAKYSPANGNNELIWSDITTMYNIFISIGILSETDTNTNNVISNTIVLDKESALKRFDEYFNTFLKIKLS